MKKVLITGSNGFTGQYLVDELAAHGWQVWGCDRQQTSPARQYWPVDLTDCRSVQQVVTDVVPDAVIHLAGIAFVGYGDANAFYQVNLIGTRNLLAALATLNTPPTKVVLASSANVYGNIRPGKLSESLPPDPVNDYAVSKLAMEQMAKLWFERLPIVIARPFNYTGPGQGTQFVIPKLVDHFVQRKDVVRLGNIDVSREFNDVRMISCAYRILLEYGMPGATYNVCSGKPHSLGEVVDMLIELAGYQIRVEVDPALVRENEVKVLYGDPEKFNHLAQMTGQIVTLYPLETNLKRMLNPSPARSNRPPQR